MVGVSLVASWYRCGLLDREGTLAWLFFCFTSHYLEAQIVCIWIVYGFSGSEVRNGLSFVVGCWFGCCWFFVLPGGLGVVWK